MLSEMANSGPSTDTWVAITTCKQTHKFINIADEDAAAAATATGDGGGRKCSHFAAQGSGGGTLQDRLLPREL